MDRFFFWIAVMRTRCGQADTTEIRRTSLISWFHLEKFLVTIAATQQN